jgi:alpha-glucosidase
MLGDKYLIAPVVSREHVREVRLPKGKWKDENGKIYKGGQTLRFDIPLERVLYFEKQ